MALSSVPVEVTLPPINQPLFDKATGLVTDPWYRYFESARNRSGGDIDLVDGTKVAASVADDKAVTADEKAVTADGKAEGAQADVDALAENEIIAGIGLEGGGAVGGDITIDAKQQVGWVISTGTGDPVTPYSPYVAPTFAAPPTMADAQALADALEALSLRYVALEQSIAANEGIAP